MIISIDILVPSHQDSEVKGWILGFSSLRSSHITHQPHKVWLDNSDNVEMNLDRVIQMSFSIHTSYVCDRRLDIETTSTLLKLLNKEHSTIWGVLMLMWRTVMGTTWLYKTVATRHIFATSSSKPAYDDREKSWISRY